MTYGSVNLPHNTIQYHILLTQYLQTSAHYQKQTKNMMQYDAWNIVNHTNTLYDANQGIAGHRFAHLPKMIFLPCLPPFPHF